jgi:malate/lactate dehydrogenase
MAGELEDLEQASHIMKRKIKFTADFEGCDFIFICAGYARKKILGGAFESDEDLFKKNLPIVSMIFDWLRIAAVNATGIYIVTNPPELLAEQFKVKQVGKSLDDFRTSNTMPNGLWILEKKGYTNHGIVAECLKLLDKKEKSL